MDLSLNDTQLLIQQSARDWMQRTLPKETRVSLQATPTGMTAALWSQMVELGWLGMMIPPDFGGSGNSFTDTAVLFEELGHGPLAGPAFSSAVLAPLLLLQGGSKAQQATWLPEIAAGKAIFTCCIEEPDRSWGENGVQLRLAREGSDYRLSGSKLFVKDAIAATHFFVAVRSEESGKIQWCIVPKQEKVSIRPLSGFLGWMAEVTFDEVALPFSDVLNTREDGWKLFETVLEKALPVLGAYIVGGCQEVLEMSLAYSRTRIQFGMPIGRFQHVQDHVIRMVNQLDAARWTTYEALWKLDSGQSAAASAHMVKAVTCEAYLQACDAAHEVHAGIGSDLDYGLTLHTQMSRTLLNYLGGPKWHKRCMAARLGW